MGEVSLLLRKGGQDNLHYPNPRKKMALELELGVNSQSSLLGLRQKVQPCVASMYQASLIQNAMHLHLTCLTHNLLCSSSPVWDKYLKLLIKHNCKSNFLCMDSCSTKATIITSTKLFLELNLQTFKMWASSFDYN